MKRGPLRYSVCRQDFSSTCKDRGLLRAFFFFFKLWTNEPFDREYSTLFKKFLSKKEYYNKISRDRTLNRIVVTFTIIRVKIPFVRIFSKNLFCFFRKKKKGHATTSSTHSAHRCGSQSWLAVILFKVHWNFIRDFITLITLMHASSVS